MFTKEEIQKAFIDGGIERILEIINRNTYKKPYSDVEIKAIMIDNVLSEFDFDKVLPFFTDLYSKEDLECICNDLLIDAIKNGIAQSNDFIATYKDNNLKLSYILTQYETNYNNWQ